MSPGCETPLTPLTLWPMQPLTCFLPANKGNATPVLLWYVEVAPARTDCTSFCTNFC